MHGRWSEDYFGDGRVRKAGHNTEGKRWDHVSQGEGVYDRRANSDWAGVLRACQQLLAIKPESKDEDLGLF